MPTPTETTSTKPKNLLQDKKRLWSKEHGFPVIEVADQVNPKFDTAMLLDILAYQIEPTQVAAALDRAMFALVMEMCDESFCLGQDDLNIYSTLRSVRNALIIGSTGLNLK